MFLNVLLKKGYEKIILQKFCEYQTLVLEEEIKRLKDSPSNWN